MRLPNFDRDEAFALIQAQLHEYEAGRGFGVDELVDNLEACVKPFTWRRLEELLEEHYPEDIFPVLPDDAERDLGPRLLSLVRLLHRQENALEQIRRLCDSTIWIMSAKDVRPILDAVVVPEPEDLAGV